MPNRRSDDVEGRGGAPSDPGTSPGTEDPLSSNPSLPWELPHTFLGLDEGASAFGRSRAVVLPVPYEATTSWGGGTRNGPSAILDASIDKSLDLIHKEPENFAFDGIKAGLLLKKELPQDSELSDADHAREYKRKRRQALRFIRFALDQPHRAAALANKLENH